MEYEKDFERRPPQPKDTGQYFHQQVINDLLRLSLEPYLFKELLEQFLQYLVSQQHLSLAPKAAIFIFDPESQCLNLKASCGFTADEQSRCSRNQLGTCHCGLAALKSKTHFLSSPPPLSDDRDQFPAHAGHYCVPILRDKQPIGVLALYTNQDHKLSWEMEYLLESVANILATVIENQKMDQQLIELVNDLRVSIVSLREEKLFSESVIQSLSHGLLVTDLKGNIIKSNHVAEQILQPFTTSLYGKNIQFIIGSRHTKELLSLLAAKPDAPVKEVVLPAEDEDGEEKTLSFVSGPRNDAHGNRAGFIISLTDITEIRYVRKEMEKMNRLSTVAEIASAVAHEVRNPLAGIKIMAQAIEEDAVESEQQLECSRRIIRQVDRLNELLSEFFNYARPVVPNKRPTSISTILAETKPLINNRLMTNAIELIEDISPDLPNIIADPNQMQQVFLNLMLNSIAAIRQNGMITINARFLTKDKLSSLKKRYPGLLAENSYVVVNFSDNGAGMSAEVADKAFEPFFTTRASGTGLGLSIVYRTLHENGAVISLETQPGKGTTFNMFFQAGE